MTEKKKQKHNYTSELELKSLLIRIKNDRADLGTTKRNSVINKYVKWHTKINNKKYQNPQKRNITKAKLKDLIVRYSEETRVDRESYERFGEIILLMIKNILKKPQFSGYTYRDDFYSDAVYKILKYLHNFDHTLISERTGTPVNSFAYISQIIHNSILFIINTKKKENTNMKKQIALESIAHNIKGVHEHVQDPLYSEERVIEELVQEFHIDTIDETLVNTISKMKFTDDRKTRVVVLYPSDYLITFDEYNELKKYFKPNMSLVRSSNEWYSLL